MSHLQFQNGYHQYEILEYLGEHGDYWEQAADAVASLADEEGHFAPYPGGGGCYDYDAVFLLTASEGIARRHERLLARTAATLLAEQNVDGGFAESLRIRPRSLDNLRRSWRHVQGARGQARLERLRQALTLLRPRHDRIETHWSHYSRGWGESDLWDSWFRMLALARIERALEPESSQRWGFIDFPGIGFSSLRQGAGPVVNRVHYVSPSVLPSRSANSVHVMLQCDGLRRAGAAVTLYARRSVADESALGPAVQKAYGIEPGALELVTCHARSHRGDSIRIAAMALRRLLALPASTLVLSRNLYASYVLGVLARRPLLFETHQLEIGPRKVLQRQIMRASRVITVAISTRLVECLSEHHGVAPKRPLVLHDAAMDGITPLPREGRRAALAALGVPDAPGWALVCGYFGQLYAGRGIEVIEAVARMRPQYLFLVFGGNDADIEARRRAAPASNLRVHGSRAASCRPGCDGQRRCPPDAVPATGVDRRGHSRHRALDVAHEDVRVHGHRCARGLLGPACVARGAHRWRQQPAGRLPTILWPGRHASMPLQAIRLAPRP
jgi:hypothetical protein